ncbi:MAG TPA: hypothetical protein VM536_21525 [Chloroflexia bacterium]|nr:hypothetical protein [Chloroflexia bacterium]
MQRLLKWLFPVVIVADVALVWGQVLDTGTALLVGGVFELLAFVLGVRAVLVGWLRYRRDRGAGVDAEAALVDGLEVLFPRPAAVLVAKEPLIWLCLWRAVFRRRPLSATEFSYGKRSVMGAFAFVVLLSAPVEVLLFELLIPWEPVRWALLVVSVYSAVWLVGFAASLRVLPYRLEPDALRLHYGVLAGGRVPYLAVDAVDVERRKSPAGKEGAQVVAGVAYLAVGGRTDLTLHLREPVILAGLFRPLPPATTLCLAADAPEPLATALRQRAGLAPGGPPAAPVASPRPRPQPVSSQ